MLTAEDTSAVLARTKLFGVLNDQERFELASTISQRVFAKGDVIVSEGEPGDHMFVIVSGTLRVLRRTQTGAIVELARRRSGAVTGELAVMDDRPRSATVEAVTKVNLLVISREQFTRLIDESRPFRQKFISHLVALIREATEHETDRALLDLRARVAKKIVELGGPSEGSLTKRDRVTKVQLAQMVGATRQRVHAALQSLESENLIHVDNLGIEVIDLEGLEQRADR